MDLSTTYLGLSLRNPLVASASPLSHTVDGVRRLARSGVAAVVMHSLFEEELVEEAERHTALAEAGIKRKKIKIKKKKKVRKRNRKIVIYDKKKKVKKKIRNE